MSPILQWFFLLSWRSIEISVCYKIHDFYTEEISTKSGTGVKAGPTTISGMLPGVEGLQISSDNFELTTEDFRRAGQHSHNLTSAAKKGMRQFNTILTMEMEKVLKDHILNMAARSFWLNISWYSTTRFSTNWKK